MTGESKDVALVTAFPSSSTTSEPSLTPVALSKKSSTTRAPGDHLSVSPFGVHSIVNSMVPIIRVSDGQHCTQRVAVPLGCSVVEWNIATKSRSSPLATLRSSASAIVRSSCHRWIATASYDGTIAIYTDAPSGSGDDGSSSSSWQLLAMAIAPDPPLKHIVWSHDNTMLVSVSQGRQDYRPATLTIWQWTPPSATAAATPAATGTDEKGDSKGETKSSAPSSSSGYQLKQLSTIRGSYFTALFNLQNQVIALGSSDPTSPFTASSLDLYSTDGLLRHSFAYGESEWARVNGNQLLNERTNHLAIPLRDRRVLIVDTNSGTLTVKRVIKAEGSGQMFTLVWWGDDHLITPSDNGQTKCWRVSDSSLSTTWSAPRSIYHMRWAREHQRLWISTPNGLYSHAIKAKAALPSPIMIHSVPVPKSLPVYPQHTTTTPAIASEHGHGHAHGKGRRGSLVEDHDYECSHHSIGCCGVVVSPCGNYVAVGDLGCNVIIWHTRTYVPVLTTKVGMMVRSITWKPSSQHKTDPTAATAADTWVPTEAVIIVGCMDGTVWQWRPWSPVVADRTPVMIFNVHHTVTCLAWEYAQPTTPPAVAVAATGPASTATATAVTTTSASIPRRLAVGTTEGRLTIMTQHDTDACRYTRTLTYIAHSPVRSTDAEYKRKFGSIHIKADMWSLCWSPCNTYICTASEDQSTRIWRVATGELLKVLTGHTTAVTCVDWQYVQLTPVENNRPFRVSMAAELRRSAKQADLPAISPSIASLKSSEEKVGDTEGVTHVPVAGRTVPTSLLATCADDRTVMLWNPDDWSVYHILRSKDVSGWYTITYHALQRHGHRIICGTENGYVLGWDLNTRKQLVCGRIHTGSIEGLHWNHDTNMIATCSSDCNAMILQWNTPTSPGSSATSTPNATILTSVPLADVPLPSASSTATISSAT